MKRRADLRVVDKEEVLEPEDAPRTQQKKREHVEKEGANRFNPGDDEVGLGPYHSIRREKITLIKRNEEKWREKQKLPCHCEADAPGRKRGNDNKRGAIQSVCRHG